MTGLEVCTCIIFIVKHAVYSTDPTRSRLTSIGEKIIPGADKIAALMSCPNPAHLFRPASAEIWKTAITHNAYHMCNDLTIYGFIFCILSCFVI